MNQFLDCSKSCTWTSRKIADRNCSENLAIVIGNREITICDNDGVTVVDAIYCRIVIGGGRGEIIKGFIDFRHQPILFLGMDIQVNLAYSSSRMASNRLTRNQVEEMYRTKRLTASFEPTKVDDIVEMMNHFICMRYVVDNITAPLTVSFVKQVHHFLTYGTYADQNHKTGVGEFRIKPDKLGIPPQQINKAVADLIKIYERKAAKLEQILAFHVQFERIHPFDDYNGRVGRILMVKECLRYGIDPFVIDDKRRGEYNRGIARWDTNPEILQKVVCEAQKRFQNKLDTCRLIIEQ